MIRAGLIPLAVMLLCVGPMLKAQVTFTATTSADAFVATGSAGNPAGSDLTGWNFGAAGMLVVTSAANPKGEFQGLLQFDLAGATNLFTTNYGSCNWTITSVALELTANYGTRNVQLNNLIFPVVTGGGFAIEWLSNDAWVEGAGTPNLPSTEGVTFNSLTDLQASNRQILVTNYYAPPGNDVHLVWPLPLTPKLVADIAGGGAVTLRVYAVDNGVGYLFNARNYGRGNEPLMHVTAVPLLKLLSGDFTNSVFRLTGRGAPNTHCWLQAATNPASADWQTVATEMTDSAGWIQFDDSTATLHPQCYYRLAQ